MAQIAQRRIEIPQKWTKWPKQHNNNKIILQR